MTEESVESFIGLPHGVYSFDFAQDRLGRRRIYVSVA